jgi:hypothetical protein
MLLYESKLKPTAVLKKIQEAEARWSSFKILTYEILHSTRNKYILTWKTIQMKVNSI